MHRKLPKLGKLTELQRNVFLLLLLLLCIVVIFSVAIIGIYMLRYLSIQGELHNEIQGAVRGLFLKIGLLNALCFAILGICVILVTCLTYWVLSIWGTYLTKRVWLRLFRIDLKTYQQLKDATIEQLKSFIRKFSLLLIGIAVVIAVLAILVKNTNVLTPGVFLIGLPAISAIAVFYFIWFIIYRAMKRLNFGPGQRTKVENLVVIQIVSSGFELALGAYAVICFSGWLYNLIVPVLNKKITENLTQFLANPTIQQFLTKPLKINQMPTFETPFLVLGAKVIFWFCICLVLLSSIVSGAVIPHFLLKRRALKSIMFSLLLIGAVMLLGWTASRFFQLYLSPLQLGIFTTIPVFVLSFFTGRYINSITYKHKICDKCGEINDNDAEFCKKCGERFSATAS